MFSGRFKLIIFIGFVSVMMLMIIVAVVSNKQMGDINRTMETIVNEYNVKTGYISTMSVAARERSVKLLQMVSMRDPFDRDEEFMYFNQLATKFSVARIKMNQLGLDEKESMFMSEQKQYTVKSSQLQEAVVQLLYDNDTAGAVMLLLEEAIPAQYLVLEQLTRMLEYQQVSARKALDDANISYERTLVQISFLILGALIVSFTITLHVIRSAVNNNDAWFAQAALGRIEEAVVAADAEGCVDYMNARAERLTGWRFAEAEGKDIIDVIRVSDKGSRNDSSDLLRAALTGNRVTTGDDNAVLMTRLGKQLNIKFSITPIVDEDERIGSVLIFNKLDRKLVG